MLCADQAIGQFWNPLSSVIAVKGGYIEHFVQAVQHDHPSLQLLKIIVSETVWLLDLHAKHICSTLLHATL